VTKAAILVVEDDARTQEVLAQALSAEGYAVRPAPSLFRARGEVARRLPDLVLLDRELPDGNGQDFCRELKASERTRGVPVIFLTRRAGPADQVVGLKLGADDYVPKPFQPEVLLARVEALLRRTRAAPEPAARLAVPGVELDLEGHECRAGGKAVRLWPKEFELLRVFLEKPGRLLRRDFICERVWGHAYPGGTRAIDVAIQRLRRKLGKAGERIETVKGYGWKLNAHGRG